MKHGHVLSMVLLALLALVIGCNSMQTSSAILRYQQGEFEIADSLCREALKVNPDDGEAYFFMALSQSMLQEYEKAYSSFKKAAELKPDRAEQAQQNIESNFAEIYNEGVEAVLSEDNEYAIQRFSIATKANPENPLGYTNLAKAYWNKAERLRELDMHGDFIEYADSALTNMHIGLDLENDEEQRNSIASLKANILGNIYVSIPNTNKEQREPYLTEYRNFTASLPEFYQPHESFAEVLFAKAEDLREKRRNESWYHDFYVYAGEAYGNAADVREAVGEGEVDMPYFAGTAYLNAEMYAEAAVYLNKAVEMDPNLEQAYYYMEFSYFKTEQYDKAIESGLFLTETMGSAEPAVYQILFQSYRAKAIAADEAGNKASFEDNKTKYQDSYIAYATYAGLDDVTPPELRSTEEQAKEDRYAEALYESPDGILIVEASIRGQFVRGIILNRSGLEMEFIEVVIDLLDADGESLGSTIAEIEDLPLEVERSFSAAFLGDGVEGVLITDILAE